MIAGIFHQGSGLGNQLHRYVATRVKSADLGVGWTMRYKEDGSGKEKGFKGKDFFLSNDFQCFAWSEGEKFTDKEWHERKVVENGLDIRSYDPEFNFIEDGTVIDGEFQDERYWAHREKDVNEWLKVEPIDIPDNVCVIGFRGGEFSVFPELFLTMDYWKEAIGMMMDKGITEFEVHTDDEALAKKIFPNFKVIHNIGINWRSMRYAKHAIIANSSFFIFPRWLNKGVTIAPRYWARRNIGVWALPQNYYSRFQYI